MAIREVAIVIHNGVQALDIAGPLDVFAEANKFLAPDDCYECTLLALNTEAIQASNGMPIRAHMSFADAPRVFHTVLVAGGPDLPSQPRHEEMSNWLREWGVRAERYGSICTGAFALGHAGLLDGRIATTHWEVSADLAAQFPAARIEYDRIYARDDRLITSGGATAGIDLTLALVNEDHGPAISLACAKRLVVVTQRQGGQSQLSPLLLSQADSTTSMSRLLAYIADHPNEQFPVDRLAELARTSVRNVPRMFAKELGVTPHEFIESVRIDRARNLLEGTDLALKTVAFASGFTNPEQMRGAFRRKLGVTPVQYRERQHCWSDPQSPTRFNRTANATSSPESRLARRLA
jgi:transcriptional regulator GlxA family with amidase domain